jgi:hypothetical protein
MTLVEFKKVLITTTFAFRLDLDADCVEEVLDCASQLQVYMMAAILSEKSFVKRPV